MSTVALGRTGVVGYGSRPAPVRSIPVRSLPVRSVAVRSLPVGPRPVRSHLRLTARGRAVLLTILATPLVIAALALGINAGAAQGTTSSVPLQKVTVVSGETLWGLAQELAPKSDPRDVIADIMSVNRMQTATIQPGEQLLVPSQYSH